MINTKNIFRQLALAFALVTSAVTAVAGPTYHVSIDTSGQGAAGALDFFLSPTNPGDPSLMATLSNFSANFGSVDAVRSGDFTAGPGGSFLLDSAANFPYLFRNATLGLPLSFDVMFSGDLLTATSVFSSVLTNADGVVGDGNGEIIFDLNAGAAPIGTPSSRTTFVLVQPSAVPEPSDLLLMLTGLGLVGFTVRRKKAAAQH